jgi:transposase
MGEQLRRDRPAPPPLGDRAPDARGEVLEIVRVDNDPVALSLGLAKAGPDPEVVLEATYGWSWAADLLPACGARVHLAHPLGSRCSATSGPETDARDPQEPGRAAAHGSAARGLARSSGGPGVRELVRYRAKLVALRSGLKAQVHAVLAKEGVRVPMSDLFGVAGGRLLDRLQLGRADGLGSLAAQPHDRLRPGDRHAGAGDRRWVGRRRRLPGTPGHPRVGPVLAAVLVAEIGDIHRFAGAPPLCSWAGLTPRHRESDTTVRRGPITKQGPGWSAGPRSRPPSGSPQPASRPPGSTASPTGGPPAVGRVAAAPRLLTLVFMACATARSAA